MKKLIALVLTLVCILALVGCNQKADTIEESHVFQAEVFEIDNGTMLLKPLQGYPEAEYADLIRVIIKIGSPEIIVGDIVEITYNGILTETYPPVPKTGVEKITVVKNAE